MNTLLKFGDNSIEFCDLRFYPDELARGNPYNCTTGLKVRSNGFAGVSPCEFDMRRLLTFTNELREMYEFRRSEIELQEIRYGGTLRFSADGLGHIKISGHIFGIALEHELKFTFDADQTALVSFMEQLRKFTEYENYAEND